MFLATSTPYWVKATSGESGAIIHCIDSKIVWSCMVLKFGFRFRTMLLLGVLVSDILNLSMLGYLLELFWELPLAGPTMLMWWASMTGFQQTLPSISRCSSRESRSGVAPDDEELDALAEGWRMVF
jgi:hypothetical protein